VTKVGSSRGHDGQVGHVFFPKNFQKPADTLTAGVRYVRTPISAEKTAVVGCLINALAPPTIALESC